MNDLGDFFAREFDETISRARQRLTLATVTTKTPFGRKALRYRSGFKRSATTCATMAASPLQTSPRRVKGIYPGTDHPECRWSN